MVKVRTEQPALDSAPKGTQARKRVRTGSNGQKSVAAAQAQVEMGPNSGGVHALEGKKAVRIGCNWRNARYSPWNAGGILQAFKETTAPANLGTHDGTVRPHCATQYKERNSRPDQERQTGRRADFLTSAREKEGMWKEGCGYRCAV